jgi:hypothetical protein
VEGSRQGNVVSPGWRPGGHWGNGTHLHGRHSGFYFRANPPIDDVDGFPRGYEAQICNHGDGYTGWLWKPGKPTGKATELLTKDGEWFSYRIRAVGTHIQFWINDKPVMTYDDGEYKTGHFAIQGHNLGMKVEAKELYFLDLSQ